MQCRSDFGILTWELFRKLSSRTESDWMECLWGMTSPRRGMKSAGPGVCGSGGGGQQGLGVTRPVRGKLVGSLSEPELFGGLLIHIPPQQHFLEMSSGLHPLSPSHCCSPTQAGSSLLCPWLASHKHSLRSFFWMLQVILLMLVRLWGRQGRTMVYPAVVVVPGMGLSHAHCESRITTTLIPTVLPAPPLCSTQQLRGPYLALRRLRPFPGL